MLVAEYFFDYAAPDLIEIHNYWSCYYDKNLLSDPRFTQNYQPVQAAVTQWSVMECQANPKSLSGIWIRTDILKSAESRERKLIDLMVANPSVAPLRQELAQCQATPDNNCIYVARTAYRFLPELRELREQALMGKLNEVFAQSRSREYDLYLLNGYRDGQAHEAAIAFIARKLAERPLQRQSHGD